MLDKGDLPAAERILLNGYRILNERRGPEYHETRQALERLVHLYEIWNRPDDAARYQALLDAAG